jgi:hypothetical protein
MLNNLKVRCVSLSNVPLFPFACVHIESSSSLPYPTLTRTI